MFRIWTNQISNPDISIAFTNIYDLSKLNDDYFGPELISDTKTKISFDNILHLSDFEVISILEKKKERNGLK